MFFPNADKLQTELRARLEAQGIDPDTEPAPYAGRTTAQSRALLGNAYEAHAWLEANGFERGCSVMAGLDSGSSWLHHEAGVKAWVGVRQWNVPIFDDMEG
jgi:hypothetical protein